MFFGTASHGIDFSVEKLVLACGKRLQRHIVRVCVAMESAQLAHVLILGRHGRRRWLPKARPPSSPHRFYRAGIRTATIGRVKSGSSGTRTPPLPPWNVLRASRECSG